MCSTALQRARIVRETTDTRGTSVSLVILNLSPQRRELFEEDPGNEAVEYIALNAERSIGIAVTAAMWRGRPPIFQSINYTSVDHTARMSRSGVDRQKRKKKKNIPRRQSPATVIKYRESVSVSLRDAG